MIERAELNPDDFRRSAGDARWDYAGAGAAPGEFYFEVEHLANCHPPPNASPFDATADMLDTDWDRVRKAFDRWLQNMRKELEAPDLWAQFEQVRSAVDANAENLDRHGDSPLVDTEYQKLVAALNGVRDQLKAQTDLTAQEFDAMRASIDRLEKSSRTMGRKDILTLAIGNVFGPVISGVLTMTHAQWLLVHIIQALTAVRVLAAAP